MIRERYVDVGDIRTRYLESGHGSEVVVLIHGGGLDYRCLADSDEWRTVMDRLTERGFHVFAIDRIGCGHTDSPRRDADYSARATIDHLDRTLQVLGIERCALVGHSRGALPAAVIAMNRPETVSALILVDSQTLAQEDPVIPAGFYSQFYDGDEDLPNPENAREAISRNSYSDTTESVRDLIAQRLGKLNVPQHPDRPFVKSSVQRAARLNREVFIPDVRQTKYEALARIREGELRTPTLLIWGLNDPSAPFKVGANLYEFMGLFVPDIEFLAFNRSGHYVHIERADEFVSHVAGYLQRIPVSDRIAT